MENSQKSRTYNSILNSLVGIASSLITVILNFIVRIVIVRELGEEVNGIHNLFQNITNFIALIEAGFSTAMVIHLYKPIKDADQDSTKAIMYFYKKVYITIAIIYTLLCVIINCFAVPLLVESSIPIWKVRIYFAIYTLITPFSYLTYHKISILYAEQKNRVKVIVATASEIVFRGLQIITVIIFHQYYLFLILMIFEKVACNLICSHYVNKRHPYLKSKEKVYVSDETKKSIYRTVRPVFINNIAANVQTSAKSILISALLGNISIFGYFGNYQLVTSTAQLLFSQFGGALTSSFGNLAVEGDKGHMYAVYRKVAFQLDWLAIILCSGFICCIQSFILLFFGEHFILNMTVVIILTIEMYVTLLNIPIISIQNAMGLHKKDQVMMIVQAVVAIILGYTGGKLFGMPGILLGLLIPQFFCTLLNKGIVINKTAFGKSAGEFILFLTIEIIKGLVVATCCFFVCRFINTGNLILDLFAKGGSVIVISLILFVALSFHEKYFKETIKLIKSFIRRRKN